MPKSVKVPKITVYLLPIIGSPRDPHGLGMLCPHIPPGVGDPRPSSHPHRGANPLGAHMLKFAPPAGVCPDAAEDRWACLWQHCHTHTLQPLVPIWTPELATVPLRLAFPRSVSVWPLVELAATRSQALKEPEEDGDSRWLS